MNSPTHNHPHDPDQHAEQHFVWANMDAYLAHELGQADQARIEAFLAASPETRDYVETQKQFNEAVRRCVDGQPVPCPEGLRGKVLAALDRCESDDEQLVAPRFPWLVVGLSAAASLMFALGLFFVFGADVPEQDLSARLVPVVSNATLDAPRSERCRYRAAVAEYRVHFPDGPELPRTFCGDNCRVSDFHCDIVDGLPVMCAVFDSPDGDRFAMLIFRKRCLGKAIPEPVRSAEVELDGKLVLMWREGDYMRALVAKTGDTKLRQRMEGLRGSEVAAK